MSVINKRQNESMKLDLVRDSSKAMRSIEDKAAIRHLRIWHCSYKTLEPISELVNLESLTVASYPDATLQLVGGLSQLRYLRIMHMPSVEDLAPLAGLAQLRTLLLETSPGWDASGKRTVVQSLLPIAELKHLEHLSLFGVVDRARSLTSLETCPVLRSAQFMGVSKKEIARFYSATRVVNAGAPMYGAEPLHV